MTSHSVTCHPAELIFRPLPQQSWYSIKRPRRDGKLRWPSWLVTHRDGILATLKKSMPWKVKEFSCVFCKAAHRAASIHWHLEIQQAEVKTSQCLSSSSTVSNLAGWQMLSDPYWRRSEQRTILMSQFHDINTTNASRNKEEQIRYQWTGSK